MNRAASLLCTALTCTQSERCWKLRNKQARLLGPHRSRWRESAPCGTIEALYCLQERRRARCRLGWWWSLLHRSMTSCAAFNHSFAVRLAPLCGPGMHMAQVRQATRRRVWHSSASRLLERRRIAECGVDERGEATAAAAARRWPSAPRAASTGRCSSWCR